ncbi:MAG: NAD(P)/FAD-dependent oxidoreductase [Fusobacteriaceae bacterium]|jgi:glycerol-3-phosphate dehydrogenase|nr:NAD(P)/FAD-dependent oxidoreductase [Fusobacteriaceae bacterium]
MKEIFDVIIIGGGLVGSAIARELSRNKLKIGVLEKNLDVCYETSGRNSGVIHGGFAYDVGSLKAKFCIEGNTEMEHVAKELDVQFIRCGKVLVGNTSEDMEQLKRTIAQGEKNGSVGLRIVDYDELHKLVPAVVGKFAMFSPNSGIIDPFNYNIALAENAHENAVQYFFDYEVKNIKRVDNIYEIMTNNDIFYTRWVINSAGLGSGKVSEMLGIKGYKVIGSKGDYIVLDKVTGALLPMPVYPVPSNTYMGIHVTNTIDGNVTVGPNAEIVDDFAYYGVSQKDMEYLAESASNLWPHIYKSQYIRNYCGILPKWVDDNGKIQDFKIEILDDIAPNAVNLVGIESPGLTSALPIARYVVRLINEREKLIPKDNFNPKREGIVHFEKLTDEQRSKLIEKNPDYGELICRCEKVTKAEILQAIHNPLGVKSVVGIKYRTRSMMGRCQGGYCQMRIVQMIEEELGVKREDIMYNKSGANMFYGKVREDV